MIETADVLIAEDHPIYRKGLADILVTFPGIGKVHEAGNGVEALKHVRSNPPALALIDLYMPEMNGFTLTATLTRDYPQIRVIILSMNQEEHIIREVYEMGARAFLSKNSDPMEIELAVKTVLNGQIYLSTQHARVLSRIQPITESAAVLDERELKVLSLLCRELTTNQIAEELCLSVRTVDRLRSSILAKTGAKTTSGVILYASRHGILRNFD
jgi:DNA-binding NarL/FixJ family response regulator